MSGPYYEAACADVDDPGIFFADTPAGIAAAKAVCARCEVAGACLADAVARGEADGVWGGQSADERVAPTFLVLADPGPPPHTPSRACYVGGCDRPECRDANAVYAAELRSRAAATRPETVVRGEQLEIGAA